MTVAEEYHREERRQQPFCVAHERVDKASEAVAALGAELRMLVKVLGWCAVFLTGVIGWSLTQNINADKRIISTISGVAANRKDIAVNRTRLADHETRLRTMERP